MKNQKKTSPTTVTMRKKERETEKKNHAQLEFEDYRIYVFQQKTEGMNGIEIHIHYTEMCVFIRMQLTAI